MAEENKDKKQGDKKYGDDRFWAISLVVIISLARMGQGMFSSIIGPTLLFLASNTGSSVAEISTIFSGKSGGMLIGSFLFSGIMNRYPNFRPLLSLSVGFVLTGVVSFIIPFCDTLGVLIFLFTLAGASLGYFECGLQSLYLKLWGEEKSRPYIQSFHFTYSIGTFIAPLIIIDILATPFLLKASEDPDSEDANCPTSSSIATTTSYGLNTETGLNTTESNEFDGINPIAWPYIIMGILIVLMSLILCIMALLDIEGKVQTDHEETYEKRAEEPIKNVAFLLLLVIGFYTFLVASENVFQLYIYSVAVCSDLQFSVTDASLLNAMFWGGLMIGRGLGIPIAKFYQPAVMLIVTLTGATLSLILISIWGECAAVLTWITTFLYGFFVATVYSTGVSWISQETNMTGSYMVVFSVGIGIGGMALVPIGGIIFDNDPFNVMYYALGLCILNALSYIGMEAIAHKRHQRSVTASSQVDMVKQEQENKAFEDSLTRF